MLKKIIIIFAIVVSWTTFASDLPCKDWQVRVRAHSVKKHIKSDGTQVKAARRKTHCREKWKNADLWGPVLNNSKPLFWSNKKEKFKVWKKREKEQVLELLSTLPPWLEVSISGIYRANKSKDFKNPASTLPLTKELVLYDNFFKSSDKKSILVHELSHILYSLLENSYKVNFQKLSGWTKKGRYYIPPKKLIKKDSKLSREKDFINYIEIYVLDPSRVKKINKKVYDFLFKRFPL